MFPFISLLEEEVSATSSLLSFLPFLLLIPIFYFLMYRPQKKQERETAQMRNSLTIGDEVVTIGGIMGRVVKVKEEYVIIETGSDRTKIKFRKSAIGSVEKKAADGDSKKHTTFKVSSGAKADKTETATDAKNEEASDEKSE